MKKILSLFIALICVFALLGCNNKQYKITVDKDGKVTSTELVDAIKNVNENSNVYYDASINRLSVELTYKNSNAKDIYNKFKDDSSKIINSNKKIILKYKEIKEICFMAIVDKSPVGNISYKVEDNNITVNENNAKLEDITESLKIGNSPSNVNVDENKPLNNDNKNSQFANYKDKIQKSLDALKVKKDGYIIDAKVTEMDSDDETVEITADVLTTGDITVGQMTNVRIKISQEVEQIIKAKKVEIDLKLNGEDKGTYTFTFGEGWDKPVKP